MICFDKYYNMNMDLRGKVKFLTGGERPLLPADRRQARDSLFLFLKQRLTW